MTSDDSLADLSDGARQLLRVAHKNDRYGILAHNACLRVTLETAWKIADAAAPPSARWTFERPPSHFLALVVNLLQRIQDELYAHSDGGASFRREYDRHALQAFALAFADVVWTDRSGDDFHGPPIDACWNTLSTTRPSVIALRTIYHYVGNILQHFFEAARIREQVRGLPDETESDLRREDARLIAERIEQRTGEIETRDDIARVMTVLEEVLAEARQ